MSDEYYKLCSKEFNEDKALDEKLGHKVFRKENIQNYADTWKYLLSRETPEELRISLAKPHVRAELKICGLLGEYMPPEIPHAFVTVRLKKSLPQLTHDAVNALQYGWLIDSAPVGCLEDMETNPHLHILIKGKHHKHNVIKVLSSYFKKANLLVNVDFKTSTSSDLYATRAAYVRGEKIPEQKKLKVKADKLYRDLHKLPQFYEWT